MGGGVGEKSALRGIGIKALIGAILIVFLFSSGCSNPLDLVKDKIARDEAKNITAFSFLAANNGVLSADVIVTITGTDISATVPYGTDVTALVATFTTTGVSATVGGTTQESGVTENNFANAVTYRVTAGDSSYQDYVVTVTIALSSEKEITSFSFLASDNAALSVDVVATITGTNITAKVPYGTDVTALVATFTTTGVSATVGGTTQESGVTENNFANAVTYTIEAADGSTRIYVVTVTNITYASNIDPANGSVISGSNQIVITFSESMDTSTLVLGGDMASESDAGVWTEGTYTNDTLTISPSTTWTGGIDRGLNINCEDLAGNPISQLSLSYTVDTTSPTASPDPTNGSTISGSNQIVITFSESMDTSTLVLGGDMASESDAGVWTEGTYTNDTLTISPSTTWTGGIDRGLNINCEDLAGNPISQLSLSYTVDTTSPTASPDPTNGSTISGSKQIVITFSESIDTGTLILGGDMASESDLGIWTTGTYTDDTLTISPSTTWTGGSDRGLTIDCADLVGNPISQLILSYTVDTNPPTASFTVSPDWGWMNVTIFNVDASSSSDNLTPSSELQVRWDWENDGDWDTSYSTIKTSSHTYTSYGVKTIKIEVKDNVGLTSTSTMQITSYEYLKWGSEGSANGQFWGPHGVAVDSSGYVYVPDKYNHRIQKFDSFGDHKLTWGVEGSGDRQFDLPSGVAVDSSGYVYVADKVNDRIQKFDSSGNFKLKWGVDGSEDGQFENPQGVAVDSSGNVVYVADTYNHRIQKFDSSGNFKLKWGTQGINDGQFNRPWSVAVDSLGNVYVADLDNYRIQKFDSSGNHKLTWGSQGIDEGQFTGQPSGVAIDSSGNVYVTSRDCIQKFDSSGSFILKWGSYGTGDGQLYDPVGVTVDSSGNVYVSDYGNERIQKFGMPP